MDMKMIIKAANVFINGEFKNIDFEIREGRFSQIGEDIQDESVICSDYSENYNFENCLILPGLVDIHTHGVIGFDFCEASSDEMKKMAEFYIKNGTTSLLPTIVTTSEEQYERQIPNILEIIDKNSPFIGINLEGPFINKVKKGAHNEKNISDIDINYARRLYDLGKNQIKLMTAAPELENFNELVNFSKNKFFISMGHSNCTVDEARKAIDMGVNSVTHLYNAMETMHHRKPALVGAALEFPLYKELICDGIHIHDSILKGLYRGFAQELVIVSDSLSACGLGDGDYVLGGLNVIVKDKQARLKDGTIAGSINTLFDGIKHLVKIGVKLEDVINSATSIPAKSINMQNQVGSIKIGLKADFIVCDKKLNILCVFKNGKQFF
jgi:N-acetylglucosamine-6-phosphate deacetylase